MKTAKLEAEKRPYEKPTVRPIDLVAEEVLAPGCKLATGTAAPRAATCTQTPCVNQGS